MTAPPTSVVLEARKLMETIYKSARKHWPGFQVREGQAKMMVNALAAFMAHTEQDAPPGAKIAIVEGKTGSGKTIGYLIPALAASLATGKKVIVSTATVALQEQLCSIDLPKLQRVAEAAGFQMHFAMLKGRGRYVCRAALARKALEEPEADGAVQHAMQPATASNINLYRNMAQALERQHWSGERDTWGDDITPAAWAAVQVETGTCTGPKCSSYTSCSYVKARSGAQSANIVVTNHSLILSSLAHETGLIDAKSSLFVFDEGHHLPDHGLEHGARRYGLLAAGQPLRQLGALLGSIQLGPADANLQGECVAARQALRDLGSCLGNLYSLLQSSQQLCGDSKNAGRWRFPHGVLPEELRDPIQTAGHLAIQVHDVAQRLHARLREAAVGSKSAAEALALVASASQRLQQLADVAKSWGYQGKVPRVKWVERSTTGSDLVLCTSALTAAADLNRLLWEPAAGALITSATITACGSFEFFERMSGLTKWQGRSTLQTESPFDYATQGEICFPRMRTTPKQMDAFSAELCSRLPALLRQGNNGQLALFSSRRQMEGVYARLDPDLKHLVLMQGTMPKAEVLRLHKQRIEQGMTSIIFGLQAFGEGIDLPGPLLEHLYIDKVPFAPPDSVTEEALAEWLEEQQRNAFEEITVPKAAQRLAQWAGRGIRTPTDWARITIFDTRLQTANYGARIMQGLPPLPVVAD